MNLTEYYKIAQQHVETLGECHPGYKYGVGKKRVFTTKYYFDYQLIALDGTVPDQPLFFGKDCGFTIDIESKAISTLNYDQLRKLQRSEREALTLFSDLISFTAKQNSVTAKSIKIRYNLSASEFKKLKQLILCTTTNDEKRYLRFGALLEDIRNADKIKTHNYQKK